MNLGQYMRGAARRVLGGSAPESIIAEHRSELVGPRARVLIVRPDHLGDMLLAGPALSLLRSQLPEASLTLLCGPWSRPIAERLPGDAGVIDLDFPYFNRRPKPNPWQPYALLVREAKALRGRFDAALILRDDDRWSAWLAARAGIPIRIGHEHPNPSPFLTHVLPASSRPAHTAAANLSLVAAALGQPLPDPQPADHPLAFRILDAERKAAAALLAAELGESCNGPTGPIAIHPGSGSPIKRWRPGAWRELLDAVAPDAPVVLTGGPDERSLTTAITALLPNRPVANLAGRTDLPTLAATFSHCRWVAGPDSGPLHLATAVGTPTLHLFGPADPARFGPWASPDHHRTIMSELPCAPCGRLDWPDPQDHPCIHILEVPQAITQARHLNRPTP